MSGKVKAEFTREWLTAALVESEETPGSITEGSIVGVSYNADRDLFEVVIESEDAPPVDEGAKVYTVGEIDG